MCTPNMELLTLKVRPFYFPLEFTLIIICTVYIPPQTSTDIALCELHEALAQFEAQHGELHSLWHMYVTHKTLNVNLNTDHSGNDF